MDSVPESVLREMAICAGACDDAAVGSVVLYHEYVGWGGGDVLVSAAARGIRCDEEKGEKGEIVDATEGMFLWEVGSRIELKGVEIVNWCIELFVWEWNGENGKCEVVEEGEWNNGVGDYYRIGRNHIARVFFIQSVHLLFSILSVKIIPINTHNIHNSFHFISLFFFIFHTLTYSTDSLILFNPHSHPHPYTSSTNNQNKQNKSPFLNEPIQHYDRFTSWLNTTSGSNSISYPFRR